MQVIPQLSGCCDSCAPCESNTVAVPGPAGPAGPAGANGINGVDGVDAYSITVTPFVVPAVGSTVVVGVTETRWMSASLTVQVSDAGWYRVTEVGVGTVTLENLGWPGNKAPGQTVDHGKTIVSSGAKGADGDGAPTEASYWLRVASPALPNGTAMAALASGYVKVTTGTGDPHTVARVPVADVDAGAVSGGNVLKVSGSDVVGGLVEDGDIAYDVVDLGSVGGSVNLNWSGGRVFSATLSGIATFSFVNTVNGKAITVVVRQAVSGGPYTVSWPAGVKWLSGAAPAVTTTPGAYAVFSFLRVGGDIVGTVGPNNAY